MRIKTTLFLFILYSNYIVSQLPLKDYYMLVQKADSLFKLGEYKKSAESYSNAFKTFNWKGYPAYRYNAACSYAMASIPDSAFFNLERLILKGHYSNFGQINYDSNLKLLHSDKRWEPLMKMVQQNKVNEEANLNKPLVRQLDSIYDEDQSYRKQLSDVEKKYGINSNELNALWKVIEKKDSSNLIQVMSTIDKYGWLGPEAIGNKGSLTLFLVIQHSNQITQEKYLPLLREAVKNGKAQASNLALLEDRVAIGQGRRQIYGSQIGRDKQTNLYYVLPLENPDEVDKRRSEVGLGPISDYVSHWKIVWDLEKYKKDLPMLEKNK